MLWYFRRKFAQFADRERQQRLADSFAYRVPFVDQPAGAVEDFLVTAVLMKLKAKIVVWNPF